jgi:hypothetical protein
MRRTKINHHGEIGRGVPVFVLFFSVSHLFTSEPVRAQPEVYTNVYCRRNRSWKHAGCALTYHVAPYLRFLNDCDWIRLLIVVLKDTFDSYVHPYIFVTEKAMNKPVKDVYFIPNVTWNVSKEKSYPFFLARAPSQVAPLLTHWCKRNHSPPDTKSLGLWILGTEARPMIGTHSLGL